MLVAGAVVVCLAAAPRAAQADDTRDATALFNDGVRDLTDKKFDRACPELRQSYRQDPRPVALFYVGSCEDQAGNIATAVANYDEYLALYDRLSPSEQKEEAPREQQATERREALAKVLPKVTLKLPDDAPPGTKITRTSREGAEVPIALNVPLPVDPGEVVIHVRAPGRPDWDHRFFINKGDQKTIDVPVPPPDKRKENVSRVGKPIEPVPSFLPALENDGSGQRIAAYVTAGVGFAGILAGVITGAVTWGERPTIESGCKSYPKGGGQVQLCTPPAEDAANQAKSLGVVSTVTFAIGGVGLVTGAILYFTAPPPAKLSGGSSAPRSAFLPSTVAVRPTSLELGWQW
jgi:hypothetical protein